MGNKRVGLFSGCPPQRPLPPPGYGTDLLLDLEESNDDANSAVEAGIENEGSDEDQHARNPEVGAEKEQLGGTDDMVQEDHSNEDTTLKVEDTIIASEESALDSPLEEANIVENGGVVENEADPDIQSLKAEPISDDPFLLYESQVKRYDTQIFRTRIAVIVSAIGILCSSIVFIHQGVDKLARTMDKGIDGMMGIRGFAQQAIDIIDELNYQGDNLTEAVFLFHNTVADEGWCPLKRDALYEECRASGVPDDDVFVNLNITNCTIAGLPFQNPLVLLGNALAGFHTALQKEIDNIERDLYELQDTIDYLIPRANSLRWAFYVSSAFALLVDLVMLVLLYGVFLAWKRKLNKPFICIRNYTIIPVFLFLTFLVWLFAVIFCFGAVLTADFCVGGPNSRFLQILYKLELFHSTTADLAYYYMDECKGPVVTVVSKGTVETIITVLNAVHDLVVAVMGFDEGAYLEECGVDISPLTFLAGSLHFSLHIVANAITGVQQLFLCSNFFPVYKTIAYDGKYTCLSLIVNARANFLTLVRIISTAMCYLGASALRNVYIALLLNLIFSLIFITLRAAWQENGAYVTGDFDLRTGDESIELEKEVYQTKSFWKKEVQQPLSKLPRKKKIQLSLSVNSLEEESW
jgi:hypothetical protein